MFDCALKFKKAINLILCASAYEACSSNRLKKSSVDIENPKSLLLVYEEVNLDVGHRTASIVEKIFILEINSVEALNDNPVVPLVTYLKLTNCKLGLLINFNVVLIKDGVKKNY